MMHINTRPNHRSLSVLFFIVFMLSESLCSALTIRATHDTWITLSTGEKVPELACLSKCDPEDAVTMPVGGLKCTPPLFLLSSKQWTCVDDVGNHWRSTEVQCESMHKNCRVFYWGNESSNMETVVLLILTLSLCIILCLLFSMLYHTMSKRKTIYLGHYSFFV